MSPPAHRAASTGSKSKTSTVTAANRMATNRTKMLPMPGVDARGSAVRLPAG
jgi:hypothetical protein